MTCQSRDSHQFLTVNCHCHGNFFSFVTVLSLSQAPRILIVNVCHCHDFDKTMCKFLTMSLSCRPLVLMTRTLKQGATRNKFCWLRNCSIAKLLVAFLLSLLLLFCWRCFFALAFLLVIFLKHLLFSHSFVVPTF